MKNYESWDERRGEGKDRQMDTQEGDSSSDSSPALSVLNDTPPPQSLLRTRAHSGGQTVNHQNTISEQVVASSSQGPRLTRLQGVPQNVLFPDILSAVTELEGC